MAIQIDSGVAMQTSRKIKQPLPAWLKVGAWVQSRRARLPYPVQIDAISRNGQFALCEWQNGASFWIAVDDLDLAWSAT